MKKILALLFLCFAFAWGTAYGQNPIMDAPTRVCTSMDAVNERWATMGISGYNGTRTTWNIYKGNTTTLAVQGVDYIVRYGDIGVASTGGGANASAANRSITVSFLTPGTYYATAVVRNGGANSTPTGSRTRTIIVEDCTIDVCKGQNNSMPGFEEDFGTTTTRIVLDPSRGAIEYDPQLTGSLNDDYYSISNQMQLRPEWEASADHTGNTNGAMLVCNSHRDPMVFYSRRVDNLCAGAVYNFSAWFRNANGKQVLENSCDGNYLYANVTFEILDAATNVILASFTTNEVSMPLHASPVNRGWQKYGGTFKTPTNVSDVIVRIRNNNIGGCGNDIAIDDIAFQYCAPFIYSFFDGQMDQVGGEYTMCAGAATNLTSHYTPEGYFGTNPHYLWQYSDDGVAWTTINGDGDGLTGYNTSVLHFAEDALLLQGDPNIITYKWFRLMIYAQGNTISCAQPSIPIRVELLPNPKIEVEGAQICLGESATLTACCGYDEYKWRWAMPVPTDSTYGESITVSPTVTTEYEVIGKKEYGNGRVCYRRAIAPVVVDVMPQLDLNLTGPNPICIGQSVDLSIDNSNEYYEVLWTPTGETGLTLHHTPATVGTHKYKVEVTNGACEAADSINIQVNDQPNITLGTIPASCNNTGTFRLPYTNPVNNPARYDVRAAGANPMPGFVNVLNQALPASPITVPYPVNVAPGTYTFTLTLRNPALSCERTIPFTVTVQAPSQPPTGILPSITEICVNGTVTLTVQGGSLANGANWAWYAGGCGSGPRLGTGPTLTYSISATTTFYVRAENASSPCPTTTCASTTVNVYPMPGNVDAGPDQVHCEDSVFIMVANQPSSNTAKARWTVMSASVPVAQILIDDITKENARVIVPKGATATLVWGTPNGVCPGKDDLITLTNYINPARLANAGPDQKLCNVTSFTLNANALTGAPTASGTWTTVYGTRTVTTPNSPTSTITVAPGDSIVLRWTVTNGPVCPAASDDVVLVSYRQPSAAVAGPDQKLCNVTSFTLAATTPAAGTGTGRWTTVYGTRTVTNPTSATSTITVAPGDSIILRWTVSNGVCTANTDDVTLVSYRQPTTAAAGPNQQQCNNANFTLAATPATSGTGRWSIVSGTPTIANVNSPTSAVTVPVGTTAVLRWTVTNGNCPPSTDEVSLANYQLPTTAAAGPDQQHCNNANFTLAATAVTSGTGRWSIVSGTPTIANVNSPTSAVTVPVGTTAVLRWTVTNGNCTPSTDDVTLMNYQLPTTAAAGPDQQQCNDASFTLAATTVTSGVGRWSVVSGTATIANVNSPTSAVTVPAGSTAVLRWTVTNGNCTPSTDDVTLINYQLPTTAAAGPDQQQCNNVNFTLAATAVTSGTGRWSIVSGTPTIANVNSPTSAVTVPVGTTAVLRWTVTNGNCPPSTDEVALANYQLPTTAAAGPDQQQCNDASFTLAATTVTSGVGRWSVVSGTATIANVNSPTSAVTVPVGTTAVLRWTVTNGNCTPSTDDVTLINYQLPTTAAAGPDQQQCNNANFTLAATAVTSGVGRWSIVSGTPTIANVNSPTSAVTVPVGTTAVLRWTVTNGNCPPSTDDVTLINYEQPTTAAAGPDQKLCNVTSFTLAATPATVGTGRWTTIYGGRTVANATSPTSTITVAPGDSVILRWTVTNGNCPPSTDDVTLVSYEEPTTAAAGPDQKACNLTTVRLAANAPTAGTGRWTTVYGGRTVADATSPTSAITLTPGDSVILRWTVTNGDCAPSTDEVTLVSYRPTTPAAAGPDQKLCNATTFTLAANTPTVGTGIWTTVSGGRTVNDPTNPASTITLAPGDSVVLRWTITSGDCPPSSDLVTLVSYAQPTTAAAGPDYRACNRTGFDLAANTPTVGTGRWTTIYGSRTVANPTSPTSSISVTPGDSIILRWTVTNGTCPPSSDDVTIVSYAQPTTAAAGPDQKLCNVTSFTLAATPATVGTGSWTTVYGGRTVTNATSPTSTITVAPGDSVILRWTVTNGNCPPSVDEITLVSYEQPTTAVAGPDQKLCNVTSFTLAATPATVGTGRWTTIFGGRTVANATSPTSTITVAPGDSVILRWTVTNGNCPPSTDDVTLVSYEEPTTAAAGPDQKACNLTTVRLAANAPTAGTGRWTTIYGGRTVANATSPTSAITLTPGDSVILRWTVTNGNCAPSMDEVTLVSYRPTTPAAAGPDQKLCNATTFTLAANTPVVGTGIWTTVSGGRTVNDPTNPASTITLAPGDSVVLRWTITSGDCPPSSDLVTLVSYAQPTIAAAGPDYRACNRTGFDLAANTPTVGTGRWTTIYGSRTVANPTSPTSSISVTPGDSIILRWTVTNGTCPPSSDDVTIVSYRQPTTAAAGPDQKMCNVTSFTLAANTPSVGTGRWTTIYGGRTVANATSPTSTIAVVPGDSIVLRWTVTNGNCAPSTDDVTLVSYAQPTTAAAGPDQKMCNVTSFTLAATPATVGTGRWTTIYGSRTVTNATSPTSTITVAPGDSIILRWTVTNGNCAPSMDDVTLVSYRQPTAATAGPDQQQCNNATFTLAANTPASGTGRWTLVSGTATIANPASPTSTVQVPAGMTATLRWTISNALCPGMSDEVTLSNYNQVLGNTITADQMLCPTETAAPLGGGTLTGGTGTYTYQWQRSTTSATTGFTNIPGATGATYAPGTVAQDSIWFRRIVNSGPCINNISNAVKIVVITRPPVVVFVPGPVTVNCKLGMDYTTLFGTPQFSHTPYTGLQLTITFTDASSVNGCVRTFTRTWTARDRCGMTTTASQTISVVDNLPPVFTSTKPADITVNCDAIPAAVNLNAYDSCFGAISVTPTETRQNIPGACANNYRLIRTWTATDGCNNNTVLTQVITVQDTTRPVFTVAPPRDTVVNCNAVPPAATLTATDNCTPGVITVTATDVRQNIPGSSCADYYQIIRTWIARDECGNSATVKQTITVQDTTRPTFSIPQPANVTVDCDRVPAWPAVTATDNCTSNVQVVTSEQKTSLLPACANNYRLIRTWTAKDNCGNTATMQQIITVQDTTRPVFTMVPVADTMVSCDAVPPPPSNVAATDNCAGRVRISRTQIREDIPGACASNYRLIRIWTATDECGNAATFRQVITVADTTRPVITPAPVDLVLNCGDPIPAAVMLSATDNCDPTFPKRVTAVEDPYVKDVCAGYTIIRRWRVTDACGNQAIERVQRITVNPCPKPMLDPVLPVNCSDNPSFTLQLQNQVNNPTYILVGVTPANAIQVPLAQKNATFNLNGATQASFVVQDGVTGCMSDTVVYNLQYSTKPMVNLGNDTTICGGNSLILDAGASNFSYAIRWSTGETTQRINVSTAGKYWVTVTNGICVTTDTINVGLIPMPLVNLPDASICRGQSVKLDAFVDGGTYLWSTGATTSSILVSTQEEFWVRVTKSGCITIDTVNVTVNPPPDISLNRDTTICPDQSIMLTVNVTNGGSIRWATGATTSSIVVNQPGLYWVTVSRDNCMVRDTVNVRLQPGINVELGPNREICPGNSITIDGTTQDAISYLWDDGDPSPIKQLSATGKYRLAVMDRFCQRVYMDSLNVRVSGMPYIELGRDTMMCIGETLRLRADGANITSVLWSDGSTGPFLDVTRAGTYSVTVSNDCGTYTDQITVDYTQCDPKPTFPNAFSPNGDGRNDLFRPVVRGPMYEYELRIFNRWGELIYLGRDSKKGWDGRYRGEPVGVGTYVWWLTYKKMPGGNPNVIKGEVTVIK